MIAAGLDKYGIRIASGGNVLAALKLMKPLKGMQGSIYYYYEIPKNEVNDWLVKEHYKRFNEPPDFFTCGGFAAAGAVVEALKKTGGKTDTDTLITTMEGMEFMTPKGMMKFRKEDHQALQEMYAFQLDTKPDVEWAIPVLTKVLPMEAVAPPIANKK